MSPLLASFALCVGLCAASPGEKTGMPWLDMDYGPFLTASIEAPFPEKNIAAKGIAVHLKPTGGAREAAVVFDTDLLRYAAGWTGGFVELKGVVYDGEHWAYPRIQGQQLFGTRNEPGWAGGGSFADPRQPPYGPLPHGWARWRGLYVHGDKVVLSYTVGATRLLELPGIEQAGSVPVFSRTIELDGHDDDKTLEVFFAGRPLQVSGDGRSVRTRSPGPPQGVTAAAVVGLSEGLEWIATEDGHARLRIREERKPALLKVLIFNGSELDLESFQKLADASPAPESFVELTKGGPSRWSHTVVTKGALGGNDGPYAIDTITPPDENPWRAWMRFGGLDWLDPERAALSTWSGDVWVVSGIGPRLERLEWRRIATGLYQPLGLKVRDGELFVVGRDQITRLRDLNGDGETDFYECFNNDAQNTEHFHEFAMDLETDYEGNFYYMKGARHARDAVVPQHGTLLKVSRDGSTTEILANGFRAPNGLCVFRGGAYFLSTDQQGHWIPANRINLLQRGSFGGNMWSYHLGPKPKTYDRPLCWIHPTVDRSPSTIIDAGSVKWGPLSPGFLSISYGMGQIFNVLVDRAGTDLQGGVVKLPLEFDTGICRARFHPEDGQLYVCGLFGWAGNKTRPGGFYRVRYTGKPVNLPVKFHALEGMLEVTFTDLLDPVEARKPGNYGVQCWNYRWTENYGSPDIRFDGREGRDTLAVASAELGADGKTLRLAIPELRPVMQLHVAFNLKSAAGAPIRTALHATIHALAPRNPGRIEPLPDLDSKAAAAKLAPEATGLVQTFEPLAGPPAGEPDARRARLAALHVPADNAASPFITPGKFRSSWDGFLKVDINETCAFEARGRGQLSLSIGGKLVLSASGEDLAGNRSAPVPLEQGLNAFHMTYESPGSGDAWARLYWKLDDSSLEPIPPAAFVHDAADAALLRGRTRRRGRSLFAERRCVRCHEAGLPPGNGVMPELAMDAPSLAGAGSRLNQDWVARWVLDPRACRSDARMPRLLSGSPAEQGRDARDIAAFLLTSVDANPSVPVPSRVDGDAAGRGGVLWASLGCFACHNLQGVPPGPAESRISLAGTVEKWQPGALVEFLMAPTKRFAWSRMPDFKLSGDDALALAAFLLWESDKPAGRTLEAKGDPARGRELAISLRCASCHQIPGLEAPRLLSPGGNAHAGCLSDRPREENAPDFGFTADERNALREFTGRWIPSLARDEAAEFAERQIETLRCTSCHERDGSPDPWLELSGEPRVEPDPAQPPTIHRLRPPLTWAGEKLRPEWTERLLSGELGYRARPHALARMPAFPAYARGLASGLAVEHGFPMASLPRGNVNVELVSAGRSLAQSTGFVCVQCHPNGAQPALAGPDTETISFTRVTDRLTEHYFYRFMNDPGRLLPGSMMPRYTTDDGLSVIRGTFEGNASRQFEAIWNYLRSIESAK